MRLLEKMYHHGGILGATKMQNSTGNILGLVVLLEPKSQASWLSAVTWSSLIMKTICDCLSPPMVSLPLQTSGWRRMPRMSTGGGGVSRAGPAAGGTSHSWREVHQRVRELRRTFLHLSVKTPTDVSFRRIGPTTLRCYFLLSPGQGRESTLFYADINLEAVSHPTSSFCVLEYLILLVCLPCSPTCRPL